MRDPNRITRIVKKIESLWYKYPDWRLCQLIMNTLAMNEDPYYIEDDKFEQAIDNLLKEIKI